MDRQISYTKRLGRSGSPLKNNKNKRNNKTSNNNSKYNMTKCKRGATAYCRRFGNTLKSGTKYLKNYFKSNENKKREEALETNRLERQRLENEEKYRLQMLENKKEQFYQLQQKLNKIRSNKTVKNNNKMLKDKAKSVVDALQINYNKIMRDYNSYIYDFNSHVKNNNSINELENYQLDIGDRLMTIKNEISNLMLIPIYKVFFGNELNTLRKEIDNQIYEYLPSKLETERKYL